LAMWLLKVACKIPGVRFMLKRSFTINDKRLQRNLFGLSFENPVGLAAGFDKDARWIDELSSLGFGFVEIGTLTPKAQPGNEKPRLFRLPEDHALINRMGFNNGGVMAATERLKKRKSHVIVGGNIGKNKTTENEQAVNDYLICFEELFPYVDYFAVNVSSPNTPGLRALQEKKPLLEILLRLQEANASKAKRKPILLKIAPDLTDDQLNDIIDIVAESKIDGVIATNTTIVRAPLKTSPTEIEAIGAGGLSGLPLSNRSTEVIRYLKQKSGNAFPIIGAGADLIQIYTGFIYEGPGLAKKICSELCDLASN